MREENIFQIDKKSKMSVIVYFKYQFYYYYFILINITYLFLNTSSVNNKDTLFNIIDAINLYFYFFDVIVSFLMPLQERDAKLSILHIAFNYIKTSFLFDMLIM